MKIVTEIFKIDASWAEKLTKTRVSFLMNPSQTTKKRKGTLKVGLQLARLEMILSFFVNYSA